MSAVAQLLDLLDLEPIEVNIFRGNSPDTGWQRVFGGQVIAQAYMAAARTVEPERHVHSMHCYFLIGGDPKVPIIYEVDRIRDGGSFTTRRVIAIQHGQPIFSMAVSFQKLEEGFDHQATMPDVPGPDQLIGEEDLKKTFMEVAPEPVKQYWSQERPIELRPVDLTTYMARKVMDPVQHIWLRAVEELPDDHHIHVAMLAYASDMTLLDTSLLPHGRSVFQRSIMAASLDHAMWFHRPFRMDEWLLYSQVSPNASRGRGLTRAEVYNADGVLIASAVQEGLIRHRAKA